MDPMKHFAIITLGCKVNQCESAALEGLLSASGLKRSAAETSPELVVLNTCTVTGKAAMQSRQAIRQAIRNYPGATIVVTGCYAQTAPEEVHRINGIDYIIGHYDKLRIPEILNQFVSRPPTSKPCVVRDDIHHARCFAPLPSVTSAVRTRAFLKIQDGCNTFCTYCIVPYARGRNRSMPVKDVLAHLSRLAETGYREVVLTGIHLGAYGRDLEPGTSLNALLQRIAEHPRPNRIRLSSIEPTEVDSQLIAMMAVAGEGLCPHFHIPLQSGDDEVLKRMRRPYSQEQFFQIVTQIHSAIAHAAIGVDVLVGFPGESDAAFARTLALIDRLPVSYLHVFPFSARKGTPAMGFKERVPESIIKKRCRQLRQLGEEKKRLFYHANIGRKLEVLVENTLDEGVSGISENYIPVFVPGVWPPENTLIQVRIEKVSPDLTVVARVDSD
jgi:threonylcarbamoyladenosine tRNA methylthiotransferase MtaB